ncbi:hypothetical protein [Modestobacter lacusdianchii]
MEKQARKPSGVDTVPRPIAGTSGPQVTGGHDGIALIRESIRPWALEAVVTAYGGDAYRLLTDLGDLLEASVAYVDRPTVEAHLERSLSDDEWSAVAAQFTAMAFDQHVGDAGTVRTDWIENRLHQAGVLGRHPRATGRSEPSRQLRRR